MPNPVVHWEIAGADGEKTAEFYNTLFGWDLAKSPNMPYWMTGPGGEGGIGGGVMTSEAPQRYATFYVMVDDLAAYLAKAESLGGKTILPPQPIPGHGACAMFMDPDGIIIGLYTSSQ